MSGLMTIHSYYPDAVKHELADGTCIFTVEMKIGGIDKHGPYLIVLDGPAIGERVYLDG